MKPKFRKNSNPYSIELENVEFNKKTTLMIRNIPNTYNVDELAEEIDQTHANCYNFLYLPSDYNVNKR